jgi:pimeloyl-CoA synthetase
MSRLAQLTGLHRVTAQNTMQKLQKEGIIRPTKYGNAIAWERLRQRKACGEDIRGWLDFRDRQVNQWQVTEHALERIEEVANRKAKGP